MFLCLLILVVFTHVYHPLSQCTDAPCVLNYFSNYLAHGAAFILAFALILCVPSIQISDITDISTNHH